MKRTLLLVLVLLFTTTISYGQGRKRKKKKDQKVYASTFIHTNLNQSLSYGDTPINSEPVDNFGTTIPGIQRNIRTDSETIGIGFSIQKIKNNNKYTELSLTKFRLLEEESVTYLIIPGEDIIEPALGSKDILFETAFRYEYGSYFNLQLESKWRVGLAGGLAPYFSYKKMTPKTSASFPTKRTLYGLKLEFVPSISYQCSKNGFIEFKWTPSIFDFNRHHVRVENPILTERQRTQSYSIPAFFQTPLSFQLHYRHQILTVRDSKKAFKKKRPEKSDRQEDEETKKKKAAIFVIPTINMLAQSADLSRLFRNSNVSNRLWDVEEEIKPLLNLGLGFQFVKENGLYNEIALTRLSRGKQFFKTVKRYAEVPNFFLAPTIEEATKRSISIATRYEFGKIFGKPYKSPMLFSVGLGVEPAYRYYVEPGLEIENINVALKLTPTFLFKLSHRAHIHFRWSPSVYAGEYLSMNYDNENILLLTENEDWDFQAFPNFGDFSLGIRVRVF